MRFATAPPPRYARVLAVALLVVDVLNAVAGGLIITVREGS